MKKIDASRRRFLAGAATAVSGIALTTSLPPARLAFAETPARETLLENYAPRFFSEPEWRFVVAACDCLIPSDDVGPGALDAHVPAFIDQQMQTEYGSGGLWYMHGPFLSDAPAEFGYQFRFTPRDIYRVGIADVDAHCLQTANTAFADLGKDAQATVLKSLESASVQLPNIPARIFFDQLLANTREGFFADPLYAGNQGKVGWKMIGFPGARGDYLSFISRFNEPYPDAPVSIQEQEKK